MRTIVAIHHVNPGKTWAPLWLQGDADYSSPSKAWPWSQREKGWGCGGKPHSETRVDEVSRHNCRQPQSQRSLRRREKTPEHCMRASGRSPAAVLRWAYHWPGQLSSWAGDFDATVKEKKTKVYVFLELEDRLSKFQALYIHRPPSRKQLIFIEPGMESFVNELSTNYSRLNAFSLCLPSVETNAMFWVENLISLTPLNIRNIRSGYGAHDFLVSRLTWGIEVITAFDWHAPGHTAWFRWSITIWKNTWNPIASFCKIHCHLDIKSLPCLWDLHWYAEWACKKVYSEQF